MIPSLGNQTGLAPAQTGSTQTTGTAASSASDALVNEQTFLQLLVAQLQNQDPLQPQDGTQFVAQLAQFSSLEQEVQMRQDLDTIKSSLANPTTNTATQNSATQPAGAAPAQNPTNSQAQSRSAALQS